MNNVVQLEAFESSLRGRCVRWFLAPGSPCLYPPGFQEQCFTDSPPFQRRILITSHESQEAWKLTDKWDAILCPTTPTDWSVAMTVVLHQAMPCLTLVTPECRVPGVFLTKSLQGSKGGLTIVCLQTLALPLPPAPITFDATFYPPAKAVEDTLMEAMQQSLQQLVSLGRLGSFTVKDALKDLRGAGATLAVSSIEERESTLYWYYATEQKVKGKDLLSSVVYTLLNRV